MSLWSVGHKIKPTTKNTVNYFGLNGPLIIIFERTVNPREWKTRAGFSTLNVALKA